LAQGETTSAIVGSVTDPPGRRSRRHRDRHEHREWPETIRKTDDSGRFSFPQLKPGAYSVKAEADRFEAQQNNSVSADWGKSKRSISS
jgi:hypothetical protein